MGLDDLMDWSAQYGSDLGASASECEALGFEKIMRDIKLNENFMALIKTWNY